MSSVISRGRSVEEVLHDLGFDDVVHDHQYADGRVSVSVHPVGYWEAIPVDGPADRANVLRALAAEFRRMAGVCEQEAGC